GWVPHHSPEMKRSVFCPEPSGYEDKRRARECQNQEKAEDADREPPRRDVRTQQVHQPALTGDARTIGFGRRHHTESVLAINHKTPPAKGSRVSADRGASGWT